MPTCVLHDTKPVSPTSHTHPVIQRDLVGNESYESCALSLEVLFAIPVVSVISSPSSTTAEFTLIRPVRPSMMPSALKSTTVLFAEASCCCRVVMEAWRAWRPLPVCLLSSVGSSGLAVASDASVRKAREDVEPNMVNYFSIVLLGVSLCSMAGPMLDICQEPQTGCIAIEARSKIWRGEWTTDGERMGRMPMSCIVQGEAIALCRPARPRGKRFPMGGFGPGEVGQA